MGNPDLVNSEIVDAFVKAYEAYRDPGDGFRECVRAALIETAPLIVERCIKRNFQANEVSGSHDVP